MDIVNEGDTCTTISNGTLTYDSIHFMQLSFNITSRYLCPDDRVSFSLSHTIDICAYAGGSIQFELVMEDDQSEIINTMASFKFVDVIMPLFHPTTSPSHTYRCDSLISTISFIYNPKWCRLTSNHHYKKRNNKRTLKGKGQKKGKGGKGKGSAGTSNGFFCEDYDDLPEHVYVFVFSKSSQTVYYDGGICIDQKFHVCAPNDDFLESKLEFLIYSKDNRLLQSFQIDVCSLNQNSADTIFGSIKLTALNH